VATLDPAQVCRLLLADTHEVHPAQRLVVGDAEGDGVRRDLAGLPGGPTELEQGKHIEPQLRGDLVGAGTEEQLALLPVRTRQHREGDRLGAPDRVRPQVADRELGR